jgi:hypothetical protein
MNSIRIPPFEALCNVSIVTEEEEEEDHGESLPLLNIP